TVDVVAGRDAVLELTVSNADVESVSAGSATTAAAAAAAFETDPSLALAQWTNSVVELWTPTAHASGFVIGSGLVLTSQRSIGTATAIEVQPGPRAKVAAKVVVADPARDVAILRIDPASAASIQPIPLRCGQPDAVPVTDGQRLVAIEAPLR